MAGKYLVDELVETRIAAQAVEDRVDFDLEREPVALLYHLCQPSERLFVVPQSHIGHELMHRWDILAATTSLIQSFEFRLR